MTTAEQDPRYPREQIPESYGEPDDDGTMQENADALAEAVVGHRIVKVTQNVLRREAEPYYGRRAGTAIDLDDGTRVFLVDTDDCCAYTSLEEFLLHPDQVDHVITGVGTTDGFTRWHIYADLGDVLELTVGWSAGNPFYYGYGFDIAVEASA